VVAEIAKECGALTIGVVTKPFAWEGARRSKQAEEGLARLRDKVDTLIVIPNARLVDICAANCTVDEAFEAADDVLRQAIQSISNIISQNGSINLDFNDVRTTMSEAGPALLAVGHAAGENRAVEAARAATTSPLLDQSIDGAHNVLFNITHSGNLQLRELDMAARVVAEVVDPSANIIFGTVVDPKVGEEVLMTVIATGFPPKAQIMDDTRDTTRIADIGLPGVSSVEDAELPAFLRRNIRSLNAFNSLGDAAVAKLAERR
jgi:cell division protein FtsZ